MDRSEQNQQNQRRILGIDGLRGIAVLSVILYHLDHRFLPGGFVGVDIFFVISGYVVCGSLLKDSANRFLPFMSAFYVRRLLRIYPALIMMLLICGALSALFIPPSYLSMDDEHIGEWAFFGLSNIAMVRLKDSYFALNNDYNPFAHTWSLGVEEQFYVIFPILLFWVLRAHGRSSLARFFIGAVLPILLVVSFAYSIPETSIHHEAAYFLLPSRFWELAAGALLCLAHLKGTALPAARHSTIVVLVGLFILLMSNLFVNPAYFPFPLAIPPVLGALLCIAGEVCRNETSVGMRILAQPPLVAIGRISYSLYLWHWVVIVLMRWTVGVEGLFSILLAVIITFALATASYFCVEAPIWRPRLFFNNRKVLALVAGTCLILLSRRAFNTIFSHRGRIGLSVVTKNSSDWEPSLGMADSPVRGRPWSGKWLFCIGDSHAGAYGGLLRTLHEKDGVGVSVYSYAGSVVGSLVNPPNANTGKQAAEILDNLRKHSLPGDVVLLASLRVPRLCQQWGELGAGEKEGNKGLETEKWRAIAVQEGERFIRELRKLQLKIIIEAPLPVFKAPPFRGSDWFNKMNPVVQSGFVVDRDFMLKHRARAMNTIFEVQTNFPDIDVWDPLWTFCSGTNCSAFDGSRPLFFDGDHLSDYGGRKLYPSFKLALEKIWN